jgi:hypothetical protein
MTPVALSPGADFSPVTKLQYQNSIVTTGEILAGFARSSAETRHAGNRRCARLSMIPNFPASGIKLVRIRSPI